MNDVLAVIRNLRRALPGESEEESDSVIVEINDPAETSIRMQSVSA